MLQLVGDLPMIASLPDNLEAFVQSEIATGRFATRDEVIAAAVRQMQLRQMELEEFGSLRIALAEADEDFASGRVRRFENETELRAFAEEIKTRGRARLDAGRISK
jgi:putative addiction module CopG family antidote